MSSKSAATVETYRAEQHQDFKAGSVKAWTDDASDIIGPFLSKRR